jgi:hypothetical protein
MSGMVAPLTTSRARSLSRCRRERACERSRVNVAITDLARVIRRNVIGALERMTGLEVVEVNVSVNDVHLPSDDDGQEQAPPGPHA